MKTLSLRTKMILGAMAVAIIPIVIVGFAVFLYVSNSLETLTREKTTRMAEYLAGMVQASLAGELKTVSLLSVDPQLVEAAQTGMYGNQAATQIWQSYNKISSQYEGLFITDKNGVIRIDAVDSKRIGLNLGDRDYFRKAQQGISSISDPVFSRATGYPIVIISCPIFDGQHFSGVVAAALKINYLLDRISSVKLGATGYSFMLKHDGILIAHPQIKYILETNILKQPGIKRIAQRMVKQQVGTEEYVFEGERKIAGFAPVGLTGWSIAVTQNRSEFLAPANTIFRNILLFIPVALAVTFTAAFVAVRRITKPILQLNAAAKVLAQGEWRQVADNGRTDELGEVVRSFNYMTSQLQQMFVSLEQSEEKYRGIYENAIEGIFQSSFEGALLSANPSLVRMLSYTSNTELITDLTNLRNTLYVNPPDRDIFLELIKKQDKIEHFETRLFRKDGSVIWVSINARLIRNSAHVPIQIEGFINDITIRKHAEEKLNRLNMELEQRITYEVEENRAKDHLMAHQARFAAMGEILSNIAHQWRQPLNNIAIIIQNMLLDSIDGTLSPDSCSNNVTKCLQILTELSNTITKFHYFYQPDNTPQYFDLYQTVSKTLQLVLVDLESDGITLELITGDNCCIYGYKNEFSQVLLHLVQNAKEVLQSRLPVEPHIAIICASSDEGVQIRVCDNGGGIAPEMLDKVFDPYFTSKFKSQGVGMGLYISKTIIEKHMGGTITVANHDDGAEVTIVLPLDDKNGKRGCS